MAHKVMIEEEDSFVLDDNVYDARCPDCGKSIFRHDNNIDLEAQNDCNRQFTLDDIRSISNRYEELDAEDLRMIEELEADLDKVA